MTDEIRQLNAEANIDTDEINRLRTELLAARDREDAIKAWFEEHDGTEIGPTTRAYVMACLSTGEAGHDD